MLTPEQMEVLQRLEALEEATAALKKEMGAIEQGIDALKQSLSRGPEGYNRKGSELVTGEASEVDHNVQWTPQMRAATEPKKEGISPKTIEPASQKPKKP